MTISVSNYTIDAGRHVVERHTDADGSQYMQTWFAPAAWTEQQIADRVTQHAAEINESLAAGEVEQVIGE